jgi:hypothetical protein
MKLLSLVGLPAAIIFSDPLTEAISDRLFSLRLFAAIVFFIAVGDA